MKSLFLAAADAVVVLHLFWIVFLILGALPGRRWAWVMWTHIASLAFSIALQVFSWICPLTHLEVWLRKLGGAQPYESTFIRHYVEQIVYAEIPRDALLFGTLIIVTLSLWFYLQPRKEK
jgi:Protein of Unknown function (DUF2784)